MAESGVVQVIGIVLRFQSGVFDVLGIFMVFQSLILVIGFWDWFYGLELVGFGVWFVCLGYQI